MTLGGELLQLLREEADALPDKTAVHLELALALAEPGTDATSRLLADKVAPHASQTRQQVVCLGQLNLETSFLRRCMGSEYIENEGSTVDDLHMGADNLLEICLL